MSLRTDMAEEAGGFAHGEVSTLAEGLKNFKMDNAPRKLSIAEIKAYKKGYKAAGRTENLHRRALSPDIRN